MAVSCFKFIDSQLEYTGMEVGMLLRALQVNSVDNRQAWFEEVRGCRRRRKGGVSRSAVAQIWSNADEYELLERRATVLRVRALIRQKGLYVVDAFR